MGVTQTLQGTLVIRPATLDLDPQVQHDLGVEGALHLETRFTADVLDALTILADQDLLLTLTLDHHQRADVQGAALIGLEFLDLDGHLVGQFIAQLTHHLLAHQLGGQEARALVGDLVVREHVLALWQTLHHVLEQQIDVGAVLGRHRNDGREVTTLLQALQPGREGGLVLEPIDLVDHQNHRRLHVGQLLEHDLVFFHPAGAVDDEDDGIDVTQRLGGGLVHEAVDRLVAIALHDVDPRGIDEDALGALFGVDTHHLVTRGLRTTRGDRDLLAQDVVHQRRLADIRATDDGDEATAGVRQRLIADTGGGQHALEGIRRAGAVISGVIRGVAARGDVVFWGMAHERPPRAGSSSCSANSAACCSA